MLAFYPDFIRTFDDLPGHVSLLIHSWNGCNMRCYGCHNYEELVASKPDSWALTGEQVIDRLKGSHSLFDAVLFSGGEILINKVPETVRFLQQVREIFAGKIVVFTNGTFPRKLQRLLTDQLVDGVHIDMKLPFHCLDPVYDRKVYEAVIGIVPSKKYCQNILESVEMVIHHNSKLSQVRTVRYPLLSEEYFEQIQMYVDSLKSKYNSEVPYFLNPYYSPQITS